MTALFTRLKKCKKYCLRHDTSQISMLGDKMHYKEYMRFWFESAVCFKSANRRLAAPKYALLAAVHMAACCGRDYPQEIKQMTPKNTFCTARFDSGSMHS